MLGERRVHVAAEARRAAANSERTPGRARRPRRGPRGAARRAATAASGTRRRARARRGAAGARPRSKWSRKGCRDRSWCWRYFWRCDLMCSVVSSAAGEPAAAPRARRPLMTLGEHWRRPSSKTAPATARSARRRVIYPRARRPAAAPPRGSDQRKRRGASPASGFRGARHRPSHSVDVETRELSRLGAGAQSQVIYL